MPDAEFKPDRLNVKRGWEKEFNFHYHREDRFKLKAESDPVQKKKAIRVRKITKALLIALAVAILALCGLFLYRYFFK